MRALITGATGFLGSYLTELLVNRGETVAILRRPTSDVRRICTVLPCVTQIEGDLRVMPEFERQIRDFSPDTIFHLAWYGVGGRYRNEEEQISRNLKSTLDLLGLAMEVGSKAWIGIGSQAEYGPRSHAIDESAPTSPTTLYGAVKLSTYHISKQLVAGSSMRFVWLRIFSTYGPRDNPECMIPYLIRTLLNGKRPSLTLGEQKWDYLYALDAAEAMYRVAISPDARDVFNLGSGRAYRLRGIVEVIRDTIDPTLPLGLGEVPYRPDQVMHLQANVQRLMEVTGWSPRVSLDEGIMQTVRWYKKHMDEDG